MRDHSSRVYNKSKVTRYRTKSRYKADQPHRDQKVKAEKDYPMIKAPKIKELI